MTTFFQRNKIVLIALFIILMIVLILCAYYVIEHLGMTELPGFLVMDFENTHLDEKTISNNQVSFELVETIQYQLTQDNPTFSYGGTIDSNESGVVLSFIDLSAPLKYVLIAPNRKGAVQTLSSSFPAGIESIAYYLPLNPYSTYEFTYTLEFEPNYGENNGMLHPPQAPPALGTLERAKNIEQTALEGSIFGNINVYKILK